MYKLKAALEYGGVKLKNDANHQGLRKDAIQVYYKNYSVFGTFTQG